MTMQFTKMHGCGNDFVLIEDLDDEIALSAAQVRAMCARHHGVGSDGVIRVAPPRTGDADVFMDYRNADGGIAEMCGNGVRCVAAYVLDHGLMSGEVVRVASRAGVKAVEVTRRSADGRVIETSVDMGAPVMTGSHEMRLWSSAPGDGGAFDDVTMLTLSMGNPHAVLVVDDVDKAPVADWGPRIERDVAFPDGTNAEFVQILGPQRIRGRIWERGVGETMASGTGASAMAAAARVLGHAGPRVMVELPGGVLAVDADDRTLRVRGPAVEVFAGRFDALWLSEVDRER